MFQSAYGYYQSGNPKSAETLLKEILEEQPDNYDALKTIGIISYQQRNYSAATVYFKKALLLKPDDYILHYLTGNALKENGQNAEAVIYYKEAVKNNPSFAEAYNNLGLLYQELNQLDEAVSCYKKALEINPELTDVYYNLGTVYEDKKVFEEAEKYYKKALSRYPDDAGAHYNLANVLKELGEFDESVRHYQKALRINPNLADAYNNMGSILSNQGLFDEAVAAYLKALQLNPEFPEAYNNLGIVFKEQGLWDKARECYETALRLNPSFIEALNNLSGVLLDSGNISEAEECLKKALSIRPLASVQSSLLFAMNYNTSHSPETIYAEHLSSSKQFASSVITGTFSHTNEPDINRKLRIGYISPDFRRHSVAYFIEPVLLSHDRHKCEAFCYSDVTAVDDVTRRIQNLSEQWLSITGMAHEKVAERIHKDKIDILIDLAGHTDKNRMPVFAHKPAPVQITWIGYPATTGLKTMDYKIVDLYTDPPGMTGQFYTEKLLRMPDTFLCYLPPEDSPGINDLPVLSSGHITFGSFNYYPKISPEILSLWIGILKAVPDSRLILKARSFADGNIRENLLHKFRKEDIAEERIDLYSWKNSTGEHLAMYNHVDIALDTFPYNGTTTTCEALWMGVPVITLTGKTHISRVGTSIMTTVGLPEFAVNSGDVYIQKAAKLAADTTSLRMLRKSLRNMMLQSPLTDAKHFTENLENLFRGIWKKWCEDER